MYEYSPLQLSTLATPLLRREIELLLGVGAYSLLPWRGGATLFCFTWRNYWREGVICNYYK